MAATLSITGVAELDRKLSRMPRGLRNGIIRKAARPAAKVAAAKIRGLAPKDTRQLEKSVKVRALSRKQQRRGLIGVRIITESPYAGAQEYGTSEQEGTPFIRPGAAAAEGEVARIFRRGVKLLILGEALTTGGAARDPVTGRFI